MPQPSNKQTTTKQTASLSLAVTAFLGLLAICIISACDKDSENGPRPREQHFDLKNECKSFSMPNSAFGFEYFTVGVHHDQPRFNPYDADELIYHERSESFSRLVKYRISTQEKTTFLDPVPFTVEIDWGRGGWIAFSDYVDVYLIKEDGSQLHKIPLSTTGHSCAEPDWNPDGTVVGFPFGGVDGISLYGMYLLYDIQQKRLDTFDSYRDVLNNTRPLDWSISNAMSVVVNSNSNKQIGIGYVNMSTLNETLIFKNSDMKWLDNNFGSGDMMWNDRGDNLYYTGGDIICFPLNEYKEIRIKKGCMSRYYEDITISPDDKHIVVERVNVSRPRRFENRLDEEHILYIMDIDGCHEKPLFDDD